MGQTTLGKNNFTWKDKKALVIGVANASSIAYAPKDDLHGRLVDSSAAGFLTAVDVSCHSFIRMARLSECLMKEGGTLFTMT